MMAVRESAVTFSCAGESLLGIAHLPAEPANWGVIFVVGAPQYRVGAHRLFVSLAREISQSGFPVFRFDPRGLGDSSGSHASFENMRDDLTTALASFKKASPGIEKVVLLGLCDGASAILLDGIALAGVEGAVLLNPWAQPAAGRTKAMQRSYYFGRLRNWRTWPAALSRLVGRENTSEGSKPSLAGISDESAGCPPFIPKMLDNWLAFTGPSLVVISQDDVTAAAFNAAVGDHVGWRRMRGKRRVSRVTIKGADHTFSSARTRDEMTEKILAWLRETAD